MLVQSLYRKSMAIYQLGKYAPLIDSTAYVTDEATLIGRVTLHENTSIWFNVVARADNEPITIGKNSNVQEACVLHTDPGFPLSIGENVSVGHQAMLHGCTIGDGSLIGIQAIILNGAKIGKNCLVGAGALVTEGKDFPDNSLIIGAPAKVARILSGDEIARLLQSAQHYVERASQYKTELKRVN